MCVSAGRADLSDAAGQQKNKRSNYSNVRQSNN